MAKTILLPTGYGKLVAAALKRPLVATYDGEHGVTFDAKPPLFGIALSSYQAMPADEPRMLVVCFMVGALSLKAARRELLSWAAVAKGSERFLETSTSRPRSSTCRHKPSPVTELPPELMLRLEVDPTTQVERIEYGA